MAEYVQKRYITFTGVLIVLLNCLSANGDNITLEADTSFTYGAELSIKCATEGYGVVFKFQNHMSTDTVRLAECQFGEAGFPQLMHQSFVGTYNVHHINNACILSLLNVSENHCGTYLCAELYNEQNHDNYSIPCKERPSDTGQSGSDQTSLIVALTVVLTVVPALAVVIVRIIKRRRHTSNAVTTRNELDPLVQDRDEIGDTHTDPNRADNASDEVENIEATVFTVRCSNGPTIEESEDTGSSAGAMNLASFQHNVSNGKETEKQELYETDRSNGPEAPDIKSRDGVEDTHTDPNKKRNSADSASDEKENMEATAITKGCSNGPTIEGSEDTRCSAVAINLANVEHNVSICKETEQSDLDENDRSNGPEVPDINAKIREERAKELAPVKGLVRKTQDRLKQLGLPEILLRNNGSKK